MNCSTDKDIDPDGFNDFPTLCQFEGMLNPVPVPMEEGHDKYYS